MNCDVAGSALPMNKIQTSGQITQSKTSQRLWWVSFTAGRIGGIRRCLHMQLLQFYRSTLC